MLPTIKSPSWTLFTVILGPSPVHPGSPSGFIPVHPGSSSRFIPVRRRGTFCAAYGFLGYVNRHSKFARVMS
ncbi:hypothetical protein BV898_01863 [Hypsibius exemplaris]|uniref:Uncharacterized protein n=1 Tax=Hypsibius exemplaris TaxID=2072580 RepID=A0A1W0XAA1_HYPEX|nr:hypothetical protein BV898_01863 [Hypsibius exemplaris]